MASEEEDDDDMPRAYGNCQCSCHKGSGIIHFKACCHPNDDVEEDARIAANIQILAAMGDKPVCLDKLTSQMNLEASKAALDELTKQAQELDMGYGKPE